MAWFAGREWTKEELLARIGDPLQVAGARGSILTDGKADGVRAIEVATGSGLSFTVHRALLIRHMLPAPAGLEPAPGSTFPPSSGASSAPTTWR